MSQEYWQQQGSEPLFPDVLWSRPQTRQGAGKLLIIGGQAQEFANVAECYAAAERAGAGIIRVIMPDSTRKATGQLPNIEYAPSNQSGSFSGEALSELLAAAQWADGVLLAGDLGKNSETSLMLEKFFNKYPGLLSVSPNARGSLSISYKSLLQRPNAILIFELSDLQKTAVELELTTPVTSTNSHSQTAKTLHELTADHPATVIFLHNGAAWVAAGGRVTSTQSSVTVNFAVTVCMVWSMQSPEKTYEAATTSLFSIKHQGA